MKTRSGQPPKLAVRAVAHDEEKPFEGDLFGRKALADQLTGWIDRLADGGVLAIDAPWGDGKSWFGRNWRAELKRQGRRTVFIDAFAADYVADPFLLLVSELSGLWKGNSAESLDWRRMSIRVAKVLAPMAVKGVSKAAVSAVLGAEVAGAVEKGLEGVGAGAEDVADKSLGDYLETLERRTQSVEALKRKLATAAEGAKGPVVIFVDELDRCRPDFALAMLERIKHFFDVPGVVFILLLNRQQLEGSVRAIYGPETRADEYLQRFVTMFVRLPKLEYRNASGRAGHVLTYLVTLGTRWGFEGKSYSDFCDSFRELSTAYGVTFRDCERALSYYRLLRGDEDGNLSAYMILLRVKRPEIFARLARGGAQAHRDAFEDLEVLFKGAAAVPWAARIMLVFHRCEAAGGWESVDASEVLKELNLRANYASGYLNRWIRQLDLVVDEGG